MTFFRAVSALLLAVACAASPSLAASPGASDWQSGFHASFRLVDGGAGDKPGQRLAGVEIRLDPHFKTYWRMPGDSGLPPSFDWSRSENVRSVEVLWPAPTRFQDAAGSSIGYKDKALLPVRVTLADPAKPAKLDLKLDYAVCEQICIPVNGEAALPLGGLLAPFASSVRDAVARTPKSGKIGDREVPAIASLEPTPDDKAVLATTLTPAGAATDIFVEGPTADWLFGVPALATETVEGANRRATWRLSVEARPADARLAGQPLTVTLTAGDKAVEAHLDAMIKPH
ncbi:protein involved in C cytochrome biogenesis [Alsobacter metallidurans]|uniref:Protein involved in C cytochrome biogenesis n=1 Tax=Alsobacter metallidurans TaxID=340221 RepID=A0A917I4I2_9HYPH|nr:protein-disulfide reductase DsbD domain-containing protein [Alsobacter metallidurans]GGH11996.1 protein involved in C cytochrome biogenesis [Alsobacter metallidurans]